MRGKAALLAVAAGVFAAGGHAATPAHAGPATAKAVSYAEQQLGKPYAWGATGPDAFDCSGLTEAAWSAAGVTIGRTSQDQWADNPHVAKAELQPGDLVFYHGYLVGGEMPPGHVVLYVGAGKIVEAYGAGVPVRVANLRPDAWGYARPGGGT